MRNITLSVDEILIKQAREKAEQDKTSLNKLFRDWISRYVNRDNAGTNYDVLMKSLADIESGGKFSRDQMNER
ncbi:MAG: hypothetical protein DRP58_08860 [Spirochaetes bacterium]|nr:MAG: hypothetical protein DRP58_08860 [Spirochaetota bacterium]